MVWQGFPNDLPSGKLTKNYGKSPFLMGKSTISMAIFNSYVKLPEGMTFVPPKNDPRISQDIFKGSQWTLKLRKRSGLCNTPGPWNHPSRSASKIAKLVHITPITRTFGRYIYIYTIYNQSISGGYHIIYIYVYSSGRTKTVNTCKH